MKSDIDRMFAMLGQRAKNGRIKKNEKYTLVEFIKLVFPECPMILEQPVSWYDRVFKTKKYKHARLMEKLIMYEEMKLGFFQTLVRLIEEDEVGRKQR